MKESLWEGALGGLIAGAIFAVSWTLVASGQGLPALLPWALFSSILVGSRALLAPFNIGLFLVGAIAHFTLSALFGAGWGAFSRYLPRYLRESWIVHPAIAVLYGVVLWLFNFQVIARAIYPWFLVTNYVVLILLHALAFGLPLGLYSAWRNRTPTPLRLARSVPA